MQKRRGLFVLDSSTSDLIYGSSEREEIASLVDFVAPPQSAQSIKRNRSLLSDVEVIFSGWGGPLMDEEFCDAAACLKAMFYAAGSVAGIITPCVWERGIRVTAANVANAIPVAEYSLATILFSLKHGWSLARETRQRRAFMPRNGAPGCYRSTVGLISLGATARHLLKLLRPFDLNVIVHDPYLSDSEAASLGVRSVPLGDVFREAQVVSLHAPLLDETIGMLTGDHFASMQHGATFINTARGLIVRQDEMIAVAANRPDLQFVLDVAEPEPLPADSPLYTLPNVVLTPHIAGSVGNECRRMGRAMVDEFRRYVAGEPLHWEVTPQLAINSSHRPKAWSGIAASLRSLQNQVLLPSGALAAR